MDEPPLDTKGNVTPVRGRMSTEPSTFRGGLERPGRLVRRRRHGVKAGPPRPAAAHREDGQGYDAQHRQHRDDQSPLLTQHSKHQIGVRRRDPVEPASPGPTPIRPPEAAADMVRVCWKPPSEACSQACPQAAKRRRI